MNDDSVNVSLDEDPSTYDAGGDVIMGTETPFSESTELLDEISRLDFALDMKSIHFTFPPSLRFAKLLPMFSYQPKTLETDLRKSNSGVHSLDMTDTVSFNVVLYEDHLCQIMVNLEARSNTMLGSIAETQWRELKLKVMEELRRIDRLKGKEWELQRYLRQNPHTFVRSGQ